MSKHPMGQWERAFWTVLFIAAAIIYFGVVVN